MRDQALLSRTLVRLDCNVPIQLDWNAAKVGPVDAPALARLFTEWGFHSLAQNTRPFLCPICQGGSPKPNGRSITNALTRPSDSSGCWASLAARNFFPSTPRQRTSVRGGPRLSAIRFRGARARRITCQWKAPAGELHLDPAETLRRLRPILENPAIGKLGQNLKYDMVVLRSAGVEMAPGASTR